MHKRSEILKLTLILLTVFAASPARATVTLLDKDDWKVGFSGFVESDMISDSTRSLTEVVGSTPIDRGGTPPGDNGRTQFSLRNSRFAFSVMAPTQAGWKTKGYMEFDFLGQDPSPGVNNNTEAGYFTNPTLRLRHGYFTAEQDGWQVLVGQTWTLFGWVPAYVLTTASVPPVTATLYQRTPQVTLMKGAEVGPGKLQGGLSLARPSQRDSRVPNVDLGARYAFSGRRAGFVSPSGDLKAEPMSIAVSGTFREFSVPRAGSSTTERVSTPGSALAVNGMLPIVASDNEKSFENTLSLSGEFTIGRGYGDEFPSWSGNLAFMPTAAGVGNKADLDPGLGGYDSTGHFTLVHLHTWNAQLQYHLPQGWSSFATAGYGQLFSNNVGTLAPVTASKFLYNRSDVFFGNIFHDFTNQIRVALELDHFRTQYIDGIRAQDNRIQASAWFRF